MLIKFPDDDKNGEKHLEEFVKKQNEKRKHEWIFWPSLDGNTFKDKNTPNMLPVVTAFASVMLPEGEKR